MIYELDPHYPGFPNPEEAEPDGMIAIGGDLSPARLINAYCCGIFPWYDDGEPILWWSLDPRMVLFPDEFRYSKSLRRVVQSGRFEVRIDTCFEDVMRSCGKVDRTAQGQDGTWITEEMVTAYVGCLEGGLCAAGGVLPGARLPPYRCPAGDNASGQPRRTSHSPQRLPHGTERHPWRQHLAGQLGAVIRLPLVVVDA